MKRALGSDFPKTETEYGRFFETPEQKAQRNREKNREHAKKTRLRKKEMVENLKMKLTVLHRESIELEQALEESNVASILLCLGGQESTKDTTVDGLPLPALPSLEILKTGSILDYLRQEAREEAVVGFDKDEYLAPSIEGSAVIDDGEDDHEEDSSNADEPKELSLGSSTEDVPPEVIKRAKNRMHAKLTRDRKRLLHQKMQETVRLLELRNQQLKLKLNLQRGSSSSASSSSVQFAIQCSNVPDR